MSKRQEIVDLLVKLNYIFRDVKLDRPMLVLYTQALEDCDIEVLKNACRSYIKTGRGFPLPVDLIELCHTEFKEVSE